MLETLIIRNIALVDRLEVSFYEGMNVLTGETGAGKSIIVDSLMLLLGGRASKDIIRTGTDKASVQGLFDVNLCPAVLEYAALHEIPLDDGQLILTREVSVSGRSVCRVCGNLVPLSAYKELTALLMDIHGQHEHQALMNENQHLHILDAFGDADHQALLSQTNRNFILWRDSVREVRAVQKDVRDNQERLDVLQFQRDELKSAHLVAGEEDLLAKERDLSRNSEKIKLNLQRAYSELYDGGNAQSALDVLKHSAALLQVLGEYDDEYGVLSDRLQNLYYETEDVALTIRDKMEKLNFDQDRLEEITNRLDLIRRLSRKYGATSEDMLKKLASIEQSLENIENADSRLTDLENTARKFKKQYEESASQLSESRRRLGDEFKARMEIQLNDLNMRGTQFQVQLNRGVPTADGFDQCAFLISPNRGEKLHSLSETASGGELSRLMLAIKSITAEQSSVPSMVFDEIDTGISGRTAQQVAQKMADIARFRQVLCVTHLTQIASMADHQYLVEKGFDGERTVTQISELDDSGRISELSRMLGGVQADTESGRTHAQELLRQAADYKLSLK